MNVLEYYAQSTFRGGIGKNKCVIHSGKDGITKQKNVTLCAVLYVLLISLLYLYKVTAIIVVLGGLVVSLPLDPRFAASNPAEDEF
jgi:hypothetical protein